MTKVPRKNTTSPTDAPEGFWRPIPIGVWTDTTFSALSNGAKLLYFALATDECPIPGVVLKGKAALGEKLGWDDEDPRVLLDAFAELERVHLVKADWKARFVWFAPGLRYRPPDNPNVIKGWARHWAGVPECPLKAEIYGVLRDHAGRRGPGFAEAFAAAVPAPTSLTVPGTVAQTVPATVPGTVCQTERERGKGKGTGTEPEESPHI